MQPTRPNAIPSAVFLGNLVPDEFTLDAVESPRNSNWFIVLIADRRALSFFECVFGDTTDWIGNQHRRTRPLLRVTPDPSHPIKSVHIYYSLDPNPTTRFWGDAKAIENGSEWTAFTQPMLLDQPLFADAN